jgi:predicted metalloprotease
LQGFETLGYGDIAPQAMLAHEYAHHIQYELGVLTRGMQLIPKTARRIELMCDAYTAYYLSHPRGAAMQGENVQ